MKAKTYLIIGVFLLVFFNLAGIVTNTDTTDLKLGFARTGEDITFDTSGFALSIKLLLIGATAAALAMGFFTKSSTENFILVPIMTGVGVALIGIFVSIWTATAGMESYIRAIVALIMLPFIAGYIMTIAEFFRGTDS